MNYDAPSLPPSYLPESEPGLSNQPHSDETISRLFNVGVMNFRRSLGVGDGTTSPPVSRTSPRSGASKFLKRSSDYAIAGSVLLVIWPVLLLIAALIRLDSRGPVLFSQERLGLRGRRFRVLKFRTMVVNAEARLKDLEHLNESDGGVLFKMKRDPRVTRFGYMLRRLSLDELPQLINILRGDMSVVGPRPLQLRDSAYLRELAPGEFARRLEVLPGLTGPWQVSGRSEVGYERMLDLDLDYIEHGSLWTDFGILWQTFKIVVLRRGAY
jgi:lipopolysaccharide/colanic/teichoic acid biosynthesis glycosyltransferase